MRVEQEKPEFKPVNVVLETREDLASLISIVGYFEGSEVPRDVETFLIKLRTKLFSTDR